ncbi:MAG: hypothetical protein KJ902_03980 [Candidatus Omnitrophica bacterium]|nr:hypothetical protein [Candidatus Omnitrophota bacterium]MBU4457883.1 hypothetical protein [Candidatus Omnitrophota bacterium]
MKKLIALFVLLVFVAGLIFISNNECLAAWGRKDKDKENEEEVKADEPKLIHAFKDADALGEFEQLYVAKQATFGRMGVLQAYFSMEQNNLSQIDAQMQEKFGFKMDPSKMYDLNRDTMEMREVGPVAPTVPVPSE